MPFIRELQELQSIHPAYPFLSVYLDVGHSEESAESMRVFLKTRLRQAHTDAPTTRDRSLLETDGRHVMAYLEDVFGGAATPTGTQPRGRVGPKSPAT